jgi:hypothetical protein
LDSGADYEIFCVATTNTSYSQLSGKALFAISSGLVNLENLKPSMLPTGSSFHDK